MIFALDVIELASFALLLLAALVWWVCHHLAKLWRRIRRV